MSLLPRSTPEAQGVPSSTLLNLLELVGENVHELHSIMVMRHGHVIAEGWWKPYAPEHPHILFSLSKSFTSTAAGFAVSEGLCSLDDTVLSFFAEDAPEAPSENLKAMRLRDLLAMATGNEQDTLQALFPVENWVRAFLACPVQRTPGTHFVYNSGATYMVAAIVQKVTGQRLLDYLTPRLLEPLGITGATWEQCPKGIDTGGWGLSVRTEDIANFGVLYLQKGVWQGKQLLPKGWVEEATRVHISNGDSPDSDWTQGYGFQFWRCRNGAYRGDGAFGQYCIVLPAQDMVVAITGGLGDMQAPMNLLWNHLLPALQENPLPENAEGVSALTAKLASLKITTPTGESTSALAGEVSGKTYQFEANETKAESLTCRFEANTAQIEVVQNGKTHRVACGLGGEWATQRIAFAIPYHLPEANVAVSGAWADEKTFVAKLCFYETPFCPILTLCFEGDNVTFNNRPNVSFGTPEPPQLVGHRI